MFPRLGGGRLESAAVSEEAAADLVQARTANGRVNEPRKTLSPGSVVQGVDEFVYPADIPEETPRVPKRETRPFAATTKAVSEQSRKLENAVDPVSTPDPSVSAEPPPPKTDKPVVVPVVRRPSAEDRRGDDPGLRATHPEALQLEHAPTAAGDVREARHQAPTTLSQNEPSERRTTAEFEPRVENKSPTVAALDQFGQQQRSATLVVPQIVVERISADSDRQPAISGPLSFVANDRLSTNAPDSPTGSDARPFAKLGKEPAQTETIEPIVNITIGRIEVRAAAPVIPPPKARNPASSSRLMSLDDYLRQRAEGGHR